MISASENSKKIAKNTLLLYLRLIVTMVISLFTARYTLQLLGAEDYGINNIAGGLIGFMGIIIITMESATQRFLAFDLGCNDIYQYKRTFSMLLNIYTIFCLIAIIGLELIGPYIINKYLVIPHERMFAAQCIFQLSLIMFFIGSICIPYTASIIAYERIGIYSYFTILDVLGQLLSVGVLFFTPFDKLISYGLVITSMAILRILIIIFYCHRNLPGCKYIWIWDIKLSKKMLCYASWNMFATCTSYLNTQGQAILLNIFFGPMINSAKAIADRVNNIITSFSGNFYLAVTPQIIKSYASENLLYMKQLVIRSSKFAFFLLSAISIPIIFNMEHVLALWLGKEQITKDMIIFCQMVLIYSLVSVLENPITQAVRATGSIKKYQILIGMQVLTFIPICFILFKLGYPAYYSMIVLSIIYFIVQFSRVKIVCPIIKTTMTEYIKLVILPISYTMLVSLICIFIFVEIFTVSSFLSFILRILLCFIINSVCIYIIGLSHLEKKYIINLIISKLHIK